MIVAFFISLFILSIISGGYLYAIRNKRKVNSLSIILVASLFGSSTVSFFFWGIAFMILL